ncbi:gamma-glutamyl-gamma-aminobutyrate hydrolase family protein [Phytomonospora endophytica]|uniref:Gamma-glutamyl-gamma-aminobutyrate hydrolase PuuD n=1 Tax=Phytomonospora endophytica TaxID=714109 RepID=A0A841FJX3_9ACTN|nr:gamma-glutamyl-gamma-aminobutyrate hydrolase family protein [Phytomonospora endophytica]MBB6036476.1 gamma-glutamyl-gamma-aminobutyrate hydrolase PuuD [Phytomonospora endophytica]GIG65798.1 putative glutamine amidotransferase [Phytomonospora endophytica]
MTRPVIGVTCYVERARFTAWDVPASLLPQSYVDRVTAAGGQPVILPPTGAPASLVNVLDGLIVAGGGDVDPARYGEPAHPETGYVRDFRDEAELALVGAALDRGLPFLGICRGMQVLNVHLGGSLHQHLPDVVGHTGHAPAPGQYGRIPVEVDAGSALAKVTGAASLEPAHYHHQALDRLGEGLSVSARTADGCVEAVELAGHPFALAVQWHPEVDADTGLFAAFVDAAGVLRAVGATPYHRRPWTSRARRSHSAESSTESPGTRRPRESRPSAAGCRKRPRRTST